MKFGTATMRTVWRFLKKLKIELPYDPAPSLLGMYPDKTIIQKDTCTSVFIAVLYTVAKTWKQPQYSLTDECIKKMWSIYTMEYYSAIKRNETMPFEAMWMDLEIIIVSEVSQTEKDKFHMISLWRRQWHPTPVLLPWKIPWMEEPGRVQSMGSLRVRHD